MTKAETSRGNLNPVQARGRAVKSMIACASACLVASLALALAPLAAHAQSAYSPLPVKAPPSNGLPGTGYLFGSYPPSDPIQSWLAMVSATQAAQPSWMTPLVTVTPRLEQEFRFDYYDQQNGSATNGQANGQHLDNYGGPGGARIEFIPAYNWEVICGASAVRDRLWPQGERRRLGRLAGVPCQISVHFGKRAERRLYRHRLLSGYPTALGTAGKISTNVDVLQPTLAFGKGWGDFDIQMTISEQYPVGGLASPGNTAAVNMTNFGDPILWNTTFQYHFMQYFWPELEVNYEYWPNGEHQGLSQVLLTPGIIFGRFPIGMDSPTRPVNLIFGVGYQFAVTPTPVVQNNVVATVRITF